MKRSFNLVDGYCVQLDSWKEMICVNLLVWVKPTNAN